MSENSELTWRTALNLTVKSVSVEDFVEDLPFRREQYGDDPDEIGWAHAIISIHLLAESAALFAVLELPREESPQALVEVRETLAGLDFDVGREELDPEERRYYDRFAEIAAPLFAEVGEVMEALLIRYVTGAYDPQSDPNELIAQALEMADTDLERAREMIFEAGAIALHGPPLWWRWREEAYGPLRSTLFTLANLVADYTGDGESPLGPPEEVTGLSEKEAAEEEAAAEEMEEEEEEAEEAAAPSPEEDRVAELIEELIERGEEPVTPEQVELCRAHREEAIPALIDLATDEALQLEDSPGDGYAPIRAVQLLGELEAEEAVPDLIDIVADSHWDTIIHSTAIYALREIGAPALEPVLTFMRYSRDVEAKTALAEVVGDVAPADERAYRVLLSVWEEATWDEEKVALAYPLAQTGGEQAIPLLTEALEDPDLNGWDYSKIAGALKNELGVEVAEPEESDFFHQMTAVVGDPEPLLALGDVVPREWLSNPEGLVHVFTSMRFDEVSRFLAVEIIILPAEHSLDLIADHLDAVEEIGFDASLEDYPDWLHEAYEHLAECAGPDLKRQLTGVLLSLRQYLAGEYDVADDPNRLLVAARELAPDDDALPELFGRAGALMLHGKPSWHRWPDETDQPLSSWMKGVVRFYRALELSEQIPLRPTQDIEPKELSDRIHEASVEVRRRSEPPQAVAELLDLLIEKGERGEETLSPAERRRFERRRVQVVPYLIRMLEDKRYWFEDGPGKGRTVIFVAQLLGELKAYEAAEPLVDAVAESEMEYVVHDAALFSLMALGHRALPAVEAYFRYGRDTETKTALAEVLGFIGRRSPDAFELLREVWQAADWTENRRMVALGFGELHDRRAVPLLQAAMKDPAADALDQVYVRWALVQLGARAPAPTADLRARLKMPAPHAPRFLYDEFDNPMRLRYTVWGKALCPDCGEPLGVDEEGNLVHSSQTAHDRPAAAPKKRKKRKRKKRIRGRRR